MQLKLKTQNSIPPTPHTPHPPTPHTLNPTPFPLFRCRERGRRDARPTGKRGRNIYIIWKSPTGRG
ncbi:MAG: hypothetical protein F6J93_01060 [Oscillatoria sp. SIO1A7]|nr:hypothetical protein [Oscillatoria sp. SIO1A7]